MLNSSSCVHACGFNLKKEKKKLGRCGGNLQLYFPSLLLQEQFGRGLEWDTGPQLVPISVPVSFPPRTGAVPSSHHLGARCQCTAACRDCTRLCLCRGKNPTALGAGCRRRGGRARVLGLPHLPSSCRGLQPSELQVVPGEPAPHPLSSVPGQQHPQTKAEQALVGDFQPRYQGARTPPSPVW